MNCQLHKINPGFGKSSEDYSVGERITDETDYNARELEG
jgi:hypothetical protein